VSISSTFYTRIFVGNQLFSSYKAKREKLLEALSYKKFVRKMLMKLTPDLHAKKTDKKCKSGFDSTYFFDTKIFFNQKKGNGMEVRIGKVTPLNE